MFFLYFLNCVDNGYCKKFEEAEKKDHPDPVAQKQPCLKNLSFYIHFFLLPVLPPRICFKSSEDVQERVKRILCHLGRPSVSRGT